MQIECNDCGELKVRVRSEQEPTRRHRKGGELMGTRFVYRDDRGRRWNGRKCPGCLSKDQAAGRVRGEAVRQLRKRSCQSCGSATQNYYHCSSCYVQMRAAGSTALAEAEFLSLHGVV